MIIRGDNNEQTKAFIKPLINATISSPYGMRYHPIKLIYKMHEGIDFVLGCGEPIYAIQDGEVIFCGIAGDYGNTIIIQHDNGIRSYYCHCSKMFYKPKRFVEQGDAIGLVGTTGMSTGCHLHFAMKVGNEYVNPINFIGA